VIAAALGAARRLWLGQKVRCDPLEFLSDSTVALYRWPFSTEFAGENRTMWTTCLKNVVIALDAFALLRRINGWYSKIGTSGILTEAGLDAVNFRRDPGSLYTWTSSLQSKILMIR
jgi:hypothetical protein